MAAEHDGAGEPQEACAPPAAGGTLSEGCVRDSSMDAEWTAWADKASQHSGGMGGWTGVDGGVHYIRRATSEARGRTRAVATRVGEFDGPEMGNLTVPWGLIWPRRKPLTFAFGCRLRLDRLSGTRGPQPQHDAKRADMTRKSWKHCNRPDRSAYLHRV
ncbi:hypothetical protein FA95DRAFT_253830 [Auriscalpium vulgare]|uniref:Uncharacterized protein n=1 Tax=Auriscalpium vulgare TaxID=40419 RepID=A0ACB8RLZ0_9AGAM|nr:hypothetical protein FA95DRAFT_253830 [Auriscalpium vulgare]